MTAPVYESPHQCGRAPRWLMILALLAMAAVGLGVMLLAGWLVYGAVANGTPLVSALLTEGIYFLPGAMVLAVTNGHACRIFASYRFEAEGLWVRFPLRRAELIPWTSFQQVCICYGLAVNKGEKHPPQVICCVKHGEKKNIYDRWKTDSPLRYRRVICIEYTPALHRGICERCPYPVADLRQTPAYRVYNR